MKKINTSHRLSLIALFGGPFYIGREDIKYIKQLFNKVINKYFTKTIIKEVVVYEKDPNGFIQNDMAWLKANVPIPHYKVGDSIEQVAYRQGQADLLRVIETRLIGRHRDGTI